MSKVFVYLMKQEEFFRNRYKIGISKSPEKRRKAIKSSSGLPTKIIKTYAFKNRTKALQVESLAHDNFDKYRLNDTEWFSGLSHKDIIKYLELIHSGGTKSKSILVKILMAILFSIICTFLLIGCESESQHSIDSIQGEYDVTRELITYECEDGRMLEDVELKERMTLSIFNGRLELDSSYNNSPHHGNFSYPNTAKLQKDTISLFYKLLVNSEIHIEFTDYGFFGLNVRSAVWDNVNCYGSSKIIGIKINE